MSPKSIFDWMIFRALVVLLAVFVLGFCIGIAGDYRTIVTYKRMDGSTAHVMISPGADHLVVRTASELVCEDRIKSDTNISVTSALWFYRNHL